MAAAHVYCAPGMTPLPAGRRIVHYNYIMFVLTSREGVSAERRMRRGIDTGTARPIGSTGSERYTWAPLHKRE